jgi:ComF family protein
VPNNVLTDTFYGRIPVEYAAAWCFFRTGGRVQHLIHQMKYKGQKDLGQFMGKLYGQDLTNSDLAREVEVIVPVPLHPKKQRKRGYNQSEYIARGLSEALKIPIDTKSLVRTTASDSQTKKNRKMRWENVKEIFVIKDLESLENKHVLLIDDVLTTGATMEACATELLKVRGIRISIAALACVN